VSRTSARHRKSTRRSHDYPGEVRRNDYASEDRWYEYLSEDREYDFPGEDRQSGYPSEDRAHPDAVGSYWDEDQAHPGAGGGFWDEDQAHPDGSGGFWDGDRAHPDGGGGFWDEDRAHPDEDRGHRGAGRSSSKAARGHRKPAPIVSALRKKPVRVAAAAVVGSALLVSAWPLAAHLLEAPHSAGVGQADALGFPGAGPRPAPAGLKASRGVHASSQPEIIGIGVASRPGRHRKPGQAASISPGYLNPLRAVSGLVPERVDEGVDFAGTGPVYALGDAVITNATATNYGWPGGGWITYQLTDGPDAGLMVYLAEDVTPTVRVGQHVSASTVIANMWNGGDGIETGWAMASGLSAESQLPAAGSIDGYGPFPTRVGLSFEDVLVSLGAPVAPNRDQAPSGILPPGYPS
jgi:hypothetical protein